MSMKIPFVDLKAQYKSIKPEIQSAINDVLDHTAFIKGERVERFEQHFAEMTGAKHCIGVGNGTDALIITLKSMGIGPGDEVIVPANSFIATSEAVSAVGATVVFADNDPKTYNIDVARIEEKITAKTRTIIPVHLYGQMADMEPIMKLASGHRLKIVEDAAQAHLSEYKMEDGSWKKAGTLGDMTTFSFFPGKNLGAYGDGGAIVTNDDALALKAKMYANHGRVAKYNHEFEGYNSRLDGMQAAILNVKLRYLAAWTVQRRRVAQQYTTLLADIPAITTPEVTERYRPVWHLYVIRTAKRDELGAYLKEKGIATGVHYPIALPNLKAYSTKGHKGSDYPVASNYQHQLLSLPVYPELTDEQIVYICNHIKSFFN